MLVISLMILPYVTIKLNVNVDKYEPLRMIQFKVVQLHQDSSKASVNMQNQLPLKM